MLRFSSISTALRFSSKLSIRGMSSVASEDVRSTTASGSQVYESKRAVFEYLFFHYGESEKLLPYTLGPKEALNFPSRCADVCIDRAPGAKAPLRALDIGCAVGASTFALAKHYDEVVGIDFSQHFIDAANVMKQDGKMEFEALTRGKVYENMLASVPSDIDRSRVHFQQGDACNLNPDLGQFDVILASNLLCRLPHPRKFLSDVPSLLKPNGSLVLISPYSWLEEYTAQPEWIGGKEGDADSAEQIKSIMSRSLSCPFELVHRQDMPFLIREHERKFQYGVSDCMVWKKSA